MAARIAIPAEVFQKRRQRLRSMLDGKTAVLTSGIPRLRNIPASSFPFRTNSHALYFCGPLPERAVLLIGPAGDMIFLAHADHVETIWSGPTPGDEIAIQAGVEKAHLLRELPAVLKNIPGKQLTAVPSCDPASNAEISELIGRLPDLTGADCDLVQAIIELRLVHEPEALAEMSKAAAVTHSAFQAARRAVAPGKFEYQVRAKLLETMLDSGCEEAFYTTCSVRGQILHNHSYDGVLQDGDLLLLDSGAARRSGYSSDVTRVWPVSGRFLPQQKIIYQLVLDVQETAIAAVKPGMYYSELHLLACRKMAQGLADLGLLRGAVDDLIERGAHALYFPHGLGHLLGLDTHDMGDFGDLAGYEPGKKRSEQFGLNFLRLDRKLAPGMVVTIEPGWYQIPSLLCDQDLRRRFGKSVNFDPPQNLAGVRGIRIEDNIAVTASGCEVLTAAIPKQIAEIESLPAE